MLWTLFHRVSDAKTDARLLTYCWRTVEDSDPPLIPSELETGELLLSFKNLALCDFLKVLWI